MTSPIPEVEVAGAYVWAMLLRSRSAALRAEPVALSQAKPAAAIAGVPPIHQTMLHRLNGGHAWEVCRADTFCRCRDCKAPLTNTRPIALMGAAAWLPVIAAIVIVGWAL